MSELTICEKAILQRFATTDLGDPRSLHALATQLSSASLKGRVVGWLDLIVPTDSPRIENHEAFPIDGWYLDSDGAAVFLMLHAIFPEGLLTTLESYRPDGEKIINPEPDPTLVKTQAADRKARHRSFTVETGWTVDP